MIPTTKTIPVFDIANYNWLIYGQPKIGKSTFASQFEDVLFIPTEAGLGALEVYKATDKDYIVSWAEFKKIVSEIKVQVDAGNFHFKMICIDTIDNLYDMCLQHICEENKWEHPSDGAFGKGWSAVSSEFKIWILRLASMSKIIFTSHATEKEVEIKKIKTSRTQPTLSGKSGEFIMGMVDMIGYISTDPSTDERVVYFIGHDALVAGDRTNRMGKVVKFEFEAIREQFEKNKKESEVKK